MRWCSQMTLLEGIHRMTHCKSHENDSKKYRICPNSHGMETRGRKFETRLCYENELHTPPHTHVLCTSTHLVSKQPKTFGRKEKEVSLGHQISRQGSGRERWERSIERRRTLRNMACESGCVFSLSGWALFFVLSGGVESESCLGQVIADRESGHVASSPVRCS